MSSKKIYTTVGLDSLILEHVRNMAKREQRSLSWIMEKALVEYFWRVNGTGKGEVEHVDKIAET